jgi:hypothetical protein
MDDEEKANWRKITAERLALRDVVVRLLAHIALNSPDAEEIFRDIFEAGDRRLSTIPSDSSDLVEMSEIQRNETDWIVNAAKAIVTKSKPS